MSGTIKRLIIFLLLTISVSFVFAGGNSELPEIPPITSGIQYISPNDDGVQEEATLKFTVSLYVKSKEGYIPEYGLEIVDSLGTVVAREVVTEEKDIGWFASIFRGYDRFELEKEISWNGLDPEGNLVADGVYDVNVWVTDADENKTMIDVDDFVVDTKAPSVTVTAGNGLLFAPNGDGLLEDFPLSLTGGTEEDLWKSEFRDADGNVVRSVIWESGSPDSFNWDGKDDGGEQADDGVYSYWIAAEDRSGNTFETTFSGIILDSRAPMIRYELEDAVFSPNDDGIKDVATFQLEYDELNDVKLWSYSLSSDGDVFAQFQGEGTPPAEIVLDGKDQDGAFLHQGTYLFSYSVEYLNGWRPVLDDDILITIDSTPPEIGVYVTSSVFSPNEDGLNDKTNISFKSSEEVFWTGSILDMDGEAVLETSSEETTRLIVWGGQDGAGKVLPDGEYLVLAKFTDTAGNNSYSEPLTLLVDNRTVDIDLIAGSGFSPNGNGKNDEMLIAVDAELYEDVTRWIMKISRDTGETVRTFTGTGELPGSVSWDGYMTLLDESDKPIMSPEGIYSADIYVEYVKGDLSVAETSSFFLDMTPPEIQLFVTADPFIKTDDGVEGSVFMSVQVENDTPISSWSLDILDDRGNILRSYAGSGDPSGDVAWNSRQERNGLLNEEFEEFTIKLAVTDEGGNTTMIRESLPLDILVVRRDGKLYLMVPNIIFGAYKGTLESAGPSRELSNRESLADVMAIYDRYPDYNLELEAHALNIYLGGSREEREEAVLLPLTEKRAETVKAALIELGMDEESIRTSAYGGQYPIADVTDRTVWWKNRRVEFIMLDN